MTEKGFLGGRRGWLAVGTLAAYAMVGSDRLAMAAVTKDGKVAVNEAPPTETLPVKKFDIPAGTLDAGIAAFEAQTGLKVTTDLPAATIAGFKTKGVTGMHPEEEGLRLLLEATDLQFGIKDSGTLVVGLRHSESVDVTSTVNSVALTQFTEPLLDTPQTVTVIPQFIMQEQAATSLRDGLRNAPGISIAAGEAGAQGDNLTIRGFSARNDIFLDGIRDFGSYYRDAFNYEAMEVLQGPASVEFGRGSTGGVVNQESKQPQMRPFVSGAAQFGTDAMRRLTADINEPLDNALGGSAIRVNLVAAASNVAERDIAQVQRFGIAPSLAMGMNTKTHYTVNYLHEGESDTPDYGLPYFGSSVAAVRRQNYYGYQADNYLRTTPDILTGQLVHGFSNNVSLKNTLRYANYPRDARITEPQVNTAAVLTYGGVGGAVTAKCDPTIANTATTAACYPVSTPLAQIQVKRAQISVKSVEDLLWDQMSATGSFNLFHIDNNVVVIAEGGRERSRPTRNTYTMPYTSLLSPNPSDPFAPLTTAVGVPTHVESQSYGVGFLDTLKLTRWLQASGGVRFDYFNTHSTTPANGTTAAVDVSRLDKQPTYRAAVVVMPSVNGSIYFDYGTSFNPSAESLSLSANNATSPPEYNSTYELGTKWAYLHERLNVNASVFRTEKLNARETDPNNSLNTINAGNQLVRGVQIGGLGHMPSSFDVLFGYAYLNSEVESSIVNASPFAAINVLMVKAGDPRANTAPYFINPAGYPLANVPKNSGNLWVTHRIKWGVTGGFGGNYVAARRASSTSMIALYNSAAAINPSLVPMAFKAIPSYVLLNAMLRRSLTERVDFQVNLNNLTNKFFIDQPHPNHLIPGEGVNAQFGFNYKF